MKKIKTLTICILFINFVYSQNSKSRLVFKSKNKIYIFTPGMSTSMKVDDSIFIIPIIDAIYTDSLIIKKRIYLSDSNIVWINKTIKLSNITWINWDGIPRKKIKAKRYYVYTE